MANITSVTFSEQLISISERPKNREMRKNEEMNRERNKPKNEKKNTKK